MDTRFIDSFVIIAECGSTAEAARRLAITSTALAQRMRVLEREFGVPLFTRSGRFMRITEGGSRLLAQARKFQHEVRVLKQAVAAEDFSGSLRVGSIRSALSNLAPPMLQRLIALHPRLETFIDIGVSQDLYHQVASGKLDAALIVEPPFTIPKSFAWRMLREEPLIVLAPRACARKDPIALLRSLPLIRYDRRSWGGSLADRYLREHDMAPQERLELDSLDGILMLVGLGLGVSLVPDWIRPQALPATVAAIALPGAAMARRIGMLWPAGSPYSRLYDAILPTPVVAQPAVSHGVGPRPSHRRTAGRRA